MPITPAPDAAVSSPWPDLPADLLQQISDRLHVATDYVHFHAVCEPWLDKLPPPLRRPALLPWLVAPRDATGHRKARCVFSSKSSSPHRAAATEISVPDRRLVISAVDGTATCRLQTTSDAQTQSTSSPVDPLSGSAAATPVPRYPDVEIKKWEERAIGVSSSDGTVVLFAFGRYSWNCNRYGFDMALRRPGDREWTLVQRNNVSHVSHMDVCLAYHKGKIILCEGLRWCVVWKETVHGTMDDRQWRWRWMHGEPSKVFLSSHLVESHDELLWVSVQVDIDFCYRNPRNVGSIDDLAKALSVSVYALMETEEGSNLRWAKRDNSSLSDRVLFLGRTASFSVDAGKFGISSIGCAYFVNRSRVYGGIWSKSPATRCRVFKYSFMKDTAELVEQLPDEWTDMGCTWITPQPTIASTEEIRERVQPRHKKAGESLPQSGKTFRIYVGNLPRKVESYQLREFFRKHGKVADARLMCDRRTGRSRGFGFVTMVTAMEGEPANTTAKINGQCLDGCPLQVRFAVE